MLFSCGIKTQNTISIYVDAVTEMLEVRGQQALVESQAALGAKNFYPCLFLSYRHDNVILIKNG